MPQQYYCPECGGILFYDASSKRYACRSCGLYVTKEEIQDLKEKVVREEDQQKRKKRQQREYLEWWLSGKK